METFVSVDSRQQVLQKRGGFSDGGSSFGIKLFKTLFKIARLAQLNSIIVMILKLIARSGNRRVWAASLRTAFLV